MDKSMIEQYNITCVIVIRPLGQVVKTSPSHGGIRGSTPLGDTNSRDLRKKVSCYFLSRLREME